MICWRNSAGYGGFDFGILGLLFRNGKVSANWGQLQDEAEQAATKKAFEWLCADLQRNATSGYQYYTAVCAEAAATARSEAAFLAAWAKRDVYKTDTARKGARAAYPNQPPRHHGGVTIAQGPPEGDSPFSMVHIDHTQLDLFCRRRNRVILLGKPWITLAIDAFTRLVLAMWLSMLPPSNVACFMVFRDMVRRHQRLPIWTITDSGADFKHHLVQQFLASHGCGWARRPKSEPRFGNPVERLNLDISEQYSRTDWGSNEAFHLPRTASNTHDPRDAAYRTMDSCDARLCELLFGIYPNRPQGELHDTPAGLMRSAKFTQGESWGIPVAMDEALIFQTLSPAHKHGGLMRMRDGVAVNGHNYFSDAMIGGTGSKLRDRPLIDYEDPTYIYVRVNGKSERCPMIDSQLRRLPSGDLRHYLSERIFLRKQSTHAEAISANNLRMGQFYHDIEEEHDQSLAEQRQASRAPAVDKPADPEVVDPRVAAALRRVQSAPISHR